MGISRACASKWVNRWRRYGDLGLVDRSSTPHHSPRATPTKVIAQIETWRRDKKWSAARITHELAEQGTRINRRTVTRHLTRLVSAAAGSSTPRGSPTDNRARSPPAGQDTWPTWT
jgi:transposase